MKLLGYSSIQNNGVLQGIFITNLGLVMNANLINTIAAIITALGGLIACVVAVHNSIINNRTKRKAEKKLEIDTELSVVELKIAKKTLKNLEEDDNDK
jgi:uncharacterized protein (DUF697 family)